MSKTTNKFSPEVRERAVRMVLEGAGSARFSVAGHCVDRREDRLLGAYAE